MLFCGFLGGAGLNQVTSTFWEDTQSIPGGEQGTIPYLKEGSQGFHVNPKIAIVVSYIIDKLTLYHLK